MNNEQKHPILQKLEEYFKNTPKEQIDKDWSNILKDTDSESYFKEKYNAALERAKSFNKRWQCIQATDSELALKELKEIFPELKENEDERIRKDIIRIFKGEIPFTSEKENEKYIAWLEKQGGNLVKNGYTNNKDFIKYANKYSHEIWHKLMDNFKNIKDYHIGCNDVSDIVLNAIIDTCNWLEKQGEQKPTDKVEPKFHEGDWIVHRGTENIYQVVAVTDNQYQLKYGDDDVYILQNCADVDRGARLYDVTKDAKDGDVLVSGDVIFIFNKIHGVWVNCYCSLHKDGSFCEENYDLMHIKYAETIYPSTKEQKDTFFAKMKEAGYEWDSVTKKIKRITEFKIGNWITNGRYTRLVVGVDSRHYQFENGDAKYIDDIDKKYRLWTIEDAKDGDVLVAHECYVIFKKIEGLNIKCYCTYHYMGLNPSFYIDTLQNKNAFHPATKEQRDTLMKVMADTGYTFDLEKKELKKIDPKRF